MAEPYVFVLLGYGYLLVPCLSYFEMERACCLVLPSPQAAEDQSATSPDGGQAVAIARILRGDRWLLGN